MTDIKKPPEAVSSGGDAVPTARENCRRTAAGNAGVHRREQEGTGHRMVSCPLLTPLIFLCAATPFGRAAKRGLRGLGSVRRFAFGTLSGPEFTLRDLPRITVRGQTVQGGGVLLRKAPLRSSADPWSTKRHCGPLAFRRATEGSRVQRRVWGRQEGAREPYGALAPFCLRRETPAPPAAGRRHFPPCRGYGVPPLRRVAASPANHPSGSSRAQIPRVFFIFSGLQLTFSIFHGILNYRK